MKRAEYSKDEIQKAVANSKTYSDVFRCLGIKINGGSYSWIKHVIKKYNLSVSHFYSKKELQKLASERIRQANTVNYSEITDLTNGKRVKSLKLKKMMLFNGALYKCKKCGLDKWNGLYLNLDVDHKDGNSFNNKLENLQFLCPNCHRQKTLPNLLGFIKKWLQELS